MCFLLHKTPLTACLIIHLIIVLEAYRLDWVSDFSQFIQAFLVRQRKDLVLNWGTTKVSSTLMKLKALVRWPSLSSGVLGWHMRWDLAEWRLFGDSIHKHLLLASAITRWLRDLTWWLSPGHSPLQSSLQWMSPQTSSRSSCNGESWLLILLL